MLDDLKYIHEKDAQDAIGIAGKQWQQVLQAYQLPAIDKSFQNVVHAGMGGSALWALLSTSWPAYTIPFEVTRGYDIPAYVNENTLFIASSYSGNTEETLSSIAQAEEKSAFIVVIAAGGKLADIARAKNYPLIELPKIDKPRYGALYGLRGLVILGEHLGILAQTDAVQELADVSEFLKDSVQGWAADVPTAQNQAKMLAEELIGKSIVIYGGPLLATAAHKWKISFNENSKNIAWEYAFPEFNHNEFTGWTSHPVEKPYAVVYLKSSFDNDRIKKRFDLSDKLLSGRWPSPHSVEAQGTTKLQQLLWTVALGDFVSLYVALLNGLSPIDTGDNDIIERFKKELG
ncbi:bifunctional phosphoglucose/phosphomannose isomerase [soil metagenome]